MQSNDIQKLRSEAGQSILDLLVHGSNKKPMENSKFQLGKSVSQEGVKMRQKNNEKMLDKELPNNPEESIMGPRGIKRSDPLLKANHPESSRVVRGIVSKKQVEKMPMAQKDALLKQFEIEAETRSDNNDLKTNKDKVFVLFTN